MILQNAQYCTICQEYIVSFSRHDYRTCTCGKALVDGGFDYLRQSTEPEAVSFNLFYGEDIEVLKGKYLLYNKKQGVYRPFNKTKERIKKWYDKAIQYPDFIPIWEAMRGGSYVKKKQESDK